MRFNFLQIQTNFKDASSRSTAASVVKKAIMLLHVKGGSKEKELRYKDNEILCFIFISLNVEKLAMKFDLVQVNGEGDSIGQASANPSQQQSQTNGGNRTSETSAN